MKRILCVAAALFASIAGTAAHAAIVTSVAANSATGVAGLPAWPSPFVTTSNPSPAAMSTAENNYGPSSLFSLGQSFLATASGNLGSVQIAISGTAPVTFNVALYNAGANVVADIGAGTYTPGAGGYSANLLADVTPQTWTGYTLAGANAAVLKFSFSGADQVPIVAGNSYIFEISSQTNPNGMVWFRNPNDATNYAGGQAYRQRSPLNGNRLRDMSIAVNLVPEPSSLALSSILAACVGFSRRRNGGAASAA